MMKRILYHIACCAAVLLFAACNDEKETSEIVKFDNNSIILDIASSSMPVSRADATGAEVTVKYLDVLIFNSDSKNMKQHYERVQVVASSEKKGLVTLKARRKDFDPNEGYYVYLIANSTHPETTFEELADLNALKSLTQKDENIHMTGIGLDGMPEMFLMDGAAYKKGEAEPALPSPVVLYDGNDTNDTELAVTLRRAAAKIVVKIEKGEDVTFDKVADAGYYLRNMPYETTMLSGVDLMAELRTPDKNAGRYFNWSEDLITVTAYAYSHKWLNQSSLEKETRLIVNIPLTYDGRSYSNSYYQIPLSEKKELLRNTYYEVLVKVNAPGAENESKPQELGPIKYTVADWEETNINIGGETDRPRYLTVNEEEMEMYNITDDKTTLRFSSSSEVTVKVKGAHYIDKFGQEKDVDSSILSAIKATPIGDLSGNIEVYSPMPTNNAIRYIELEVSNEDGVEPRTVIVKQYPLEYITNIVGWYSYRDDFGGTTYELLNGKDVSGQSFSNQISERRVGVDWDSSGWSYSNDASNSRFFASKVRTSLVPIGEKNAGKSDIDYYYWKENSRGQGGRKRYSYEIDTKELFKASEGGNARMYHIRIMSSSGEYTLGRPRLDGNGYTDDSDANGQLVSPSFMIASQLGATQSPESIDQAARHCKEYVEVYEKDGDKVVLNDWRLPTRKEVEIIINFQYKQNAAMDEVLAGKYYWCADGGTVKNEYSSEDNDNSAIRCVRDAFDTED